MHFKMFHFVIFFYLVFLSKSTDCDGCEIINDRCVSRSGETCSSYCKPNLLNNGDTTCYYCNDNDADSNNYKYYIIRDQTCTWTSTCNGLIVKYYDQCVIGSCGDLYKLGDYCYKIGWFSNSIVSCDLNHDCRCIYKYHIVVNNDGKKSYHCYSENEPCDSNYNFYYLEEHLCSATDCSNLKKKNKFKWR